jgi:hypothetical protein
MTGARRKAVLLLLVVFLAGGAAGMLLEDVVDDLRWPAWLGGAEPHGARGGDPFDDDAEEDFLESLGLTGQQREAVDRLLDRREDRLEAYWSVRLPEMARLVDSTRAEIRALLTPDQRDAYDRWVARQRTPSSLPEGGS